MIFTGPTAKAAATKGIAGFPVEGGLLTHVDPAFDRQNEVVCPDLNVGVARGPDISHVI